MADEDGTKGSGDEGGGDGKKADPKPEISFKTKAEFHAEVDRKVKSAVKTAVEETKRSFLEGLGIESEDELPTVVETVKKGKTAASEQDTLKRAHDKLAKDLGKATEANAALLGWKHTALKGTALNAYSGKTVDLETLSALVLPKLVINDDDSVTGPNGRALDDLVEDIFKTKPFLKVPDSTTGAGTKPGGGKSEGDGKSKTKGAGDKPASGDDEGKPPLNGATRKPRLGDAVVAALQSQKQNEGGAGP